MNGKILATGIVLFTILACVAVYFVFQATLNNDQNGMGPDVEIIVSSKTNSFADWDN